jgi:hypothetical protein
MVELCALVAVAPQLRRMLSLEIESIANVACAKASSSLVYEQPIVIANLRAFDELAPKPLAPGGHPRLPDIVIG